MMIQQSDQAWAWTHNFRISPVVALIQYQSLISVSQSSCLELHVSMDISLFQAQLNESFEIENTRKRKVSCKHCSMAFISNYWLKKHIPRCTKNPNRNPLEEDKPLVRQLEPIVFRRHDRFREMEKYAMYYDDGRYFWWVVLVPYPLVKYCHFYWWENHFNQVVCHL